MSRQSIWCWSVVFAHLVLGALSTARARAAADQPADLDVERVISRLHGSDKTKQSEVVQDFRDTQLLIDSDPRFLASFRSNNAYAAEMHRLEAAIRKAALRHQTSLMSVFETSRSPIGACAGAVLAVSAEGNDPSVRTALRKLAMSPDADVESRLIAYAGLMLDNKDDKPIVLPCLRAWSLLPAATRADIWQKIGSGDIVSSEVGGRMIAIDANAPTQNPIVVDSILESIERIGISAVREAAMIIEIGRGSNEAQGVLAATADECPPDVRVFALRLLSNRRLAQEIYEDLHRVRECMLDSSFAVRCAAAQTLITLGLDGGGGSNYGQLAADVSRGVLVGDGLAALERLLRRTRRDSEGWCNMADLSQSRIPDVFVRTNVFLLDECACAFKRGNAGQRRLAVLRITDRALLSSRTDEFRRAVMELMRRQVHVEVDRSVLDQLADALRALGNFIDDEE